MSDVLIKLFATVLWCLLMFWGGARGTIKVNDEPVHPILAPVVALLMGVGFLVVVAVCLLPVWIWFVG